jgi:L-seryl-tRNA(Ser) seleniumtransferase
VRNDVFRELPSVDRLAATLPGPRREAVAAARAVIEARRSELAAGTGGGHEVDLMERARDELARRQRPSLRGVLNATGVVLHTNLGRAPLAAAARAAVTRAAAGYVNLELDLDQGRRGSRQAHVDGLLRELTGAEASLVVNNGAAAALLAVAALAGAGGAVIVSRGQLVEIGGGFRVPEVIAQAGAQLIEVGTTNRTRAGDYRRAIERLGEDRAQAIVLRVHPSNFRILGFVETVEVEELCTLGLPVVDDLGSGAIDASALGLGDEPDVRRSVVAGVALACFSGDKLLGGPQAGVLVGCAEAIERARRHPLARALRIDKLSLAALEATLRLYRDPERARREIPALRMLAAPEAELAARAAAIADGIGAAAEIVRTAGRVGGGALPLLELEGPAVAVDPAPAGAEELAERLRAGEPPVLARIRTDRLLLDPRTLSDEEARIVAGQVSRALAGGAA